MGRGYEGSSVSSRVCLYSHKDVLAYTVLSHRWQASEVYLTRARSKSLEMMECATIDTVIALHLISTANFGCGKSKLEFVLHSH